MALYPTHIPTTALQKCLLSAGSAVISLVAPWRGDMVATMGETTGGSVLPNIRQRMMSDDTGQQILQEKPRIRNSTIDVHHLRTLVDGTLGREYARFLDTLHTSPDARPPVQFVDDVELAYVMQRYRETHDLYHTVLAMKTDILGEVAVKWFEGIQLGLPMCVLGGLFGSLRLYPKQRVLYREVVLPWIVRNARQANFFMNVYWEKHWEEPLDSLRSRLNIESPPLPPKP